MDDRPRPCFFCGYDLSGAPGVMKCPECGKPALDAGQVLDHRAVTGRRARWIAILAISIVAVGLILFVAYAAIYEPFPP
jgi:hypothetical protein